MAEKQAAVHLLDVGGGSYGDCVLCHIGGEWILIDGGHKGDIDGSEGHRAIPDQIREAMGLDEGESITVSLLVISHAHDDHIGCLPKLIADDKLTAEWALLVDPDLAWPPMAGDANEPARRLFAMLREEPRLDIANGADFAAAATDAVRLEDHYRQMIRKLQKDGTKVVLHGKSSVKALQERFATAGLQIVGPSKAAIRACADFVFKVEHDFVAEARTAVADNNESAFAFYKELMGAWVDSPDAGGSRFGAALNMQSSLLVFSDGVHKFLFTGDAQLEKPGFDAPVVAKSVAGSLARIGELAPYDFVKLGHHGSHNAFGNKLLTELGAQTQHFGVCTGAGSTYHPQSSVLASIKEHADDFLLGRTDVNGMVSFYFKDGEVFYSKERGRINDMSGPQGARGRDLGAETTVLGTRGEAAVPAVVVPQPTTGSGPQPIEIRIPYDPLLGIDLSLQLKIAPTTGVATVQALPATADQERLANPLEAFRLANGRELPPLLFLTHSQRLEAKVGKPVVDAVQAAVLAGGHQWVDVAGLAHTTVEAISNYMRRFLNGEPTPEGVVILGGYDVIPAERRDVLAVVTRNQEALRGRDYDGFKVWSDHVYGDDDGDRLPEVPTSRIPDGGSANLLLAALGAPAHTLLARHGVRNLARPFADQIYTQHMIGPLPMISSHPAVAGTYATQGDHFYFMLHGDYADATRFWGESNHGDLAEALRLQHVTVPPGAVVFTGCCWGALPVQEPAFLNGATLNPRTAADSIALRCLEQGALAYIGCTGVHYSPKEPPYQQFGGVLHRLFWERLRENLPPAKALHAAKVQFAAGITKRSKNLWHQSIERKLFEQFHLLGLGW